MRVQWWIAGLCAGLSSGFALAPHVVTALGPLAGFAISLVFCVLGVAWAHAKEG